MAGFLSELRGAFLLAFVKERNDLVAHFHYAEKSTMFAISQCLEEKF